MLMMPMMLMIADEEEEEEKEEKRRKKNTTPQAHSGLATLGGRDHMIGEALCPESFSL